MSEKELARWLMDLAVCYDHVPQKAAIARYLRILSRWKLSPAQWEKLGDLAVIRLTRRFPMPGELQEIASELREEAELHADPRTYLNNAALVNTSPASACNNAYVTRTLRDISLLSGIYRLNGPYVTIVDWDTPNTAPSTTSNGQWTFARGNNGFNDAMTYFHIDQN